jgi:hypothetical protein
MASRILVTEALLSLIGFDIWIKPPTTLRITAPVFG